MKISAYFSAALLVALAAGMTSCDNDMENPTNRVFEPTSTVVNNVLVDGTESEFTRTVQAEIAKPLNHDITVTFSTDNKNITDSYNAIYGADAITLPEEFYEIPDPVATIKAGAVKSNEVTVKFKNLDQLNTDYTYVLGVFIKDAGVEILESSRLKYFVVRGAALINVVADLTKNHLGLTNPGSCAGLNGLRQITVESLLWFDEFGAGGEAGITTWMGIEGNTLLRFGDAGISPQQLQFAASSNTTSADWTVEGNKWQFCTFTYDADSREMCFYVNGVKKGGTVRAAAAPTINWNVASFYVGKSWSDNRYLAGRIGEARIWNRVLTQEEINEKNHFYTVDPTADGLVAYWKFNEGTGAQVADYANGYDLTANKPLTWVEVALPEK